jgi:hypothetical protein
MQYRNVAKPTHYRGDVEVVRGKGTSTWAEINLEEVKGASCNIAAIT